MLVEKPSVQADSYRGDAAKTKSTFITPRGAFRFTSTKDERVQVSQLDRKFLLNCLR